MEPTLGPCKNGVQPHITAPHHAGEVRTAEARGSATPMRSVNGVQEAGERVFAH